MKKLIVFVLAIGLMFSITSCSLFIKSPEKVVDDAMQSIQMYNLDKISYYWDDSYVLFKNSSYSLLINEIDAFSAKDANEQKLFEKFFSKLDYQINVSTVNKNKTTVNVTITTINMSNKIMDLSYKLMFDGLYNKDNSYTSMGFLNAILDQEDPDLITKAVDINLILQDNEWKITESNEALDAILGNLLYAMYSLGWILD